MPDKRMCRAEPDSACPLCSPGNNICGHGVRARQWSKRKATGKNHPMSFQLTLRMSATAVVIALANSVVRAQDKALPALPPAPATVEKTAEQVIVTVNGTSLTADELESQVRQQLARMGGRVPPQQLQSIMPRMKTQIVEQFVTVTLLKEESAKQKITVTDKEVQVKLDDLAKGLPPGMTLEKALQAQNMTIADLRGQIRDDTMVRKLLDGTLPKEFEVTDKEVSAFYEANKSRMGTPESVRARHVLVSFEPGDDDATKAAKKAEIDAIRKELLADGADFAKIAEAKSDCPSGKKGGDLGTFQRGRMAKQFEDAAFSQKTNKIGPVVESPFGYHVIEVLAHNQVDTRPLEEVAPRISDYLKEQKRGEAFTNYIESLKQKADVKYPDAAAKPPAAE